MKTREKNTSAGRKGTFIGKWSPNKNSASAHAAKKGASRTIKNYNQALNWLGGGDR
jgi:hypothetical protein